MNSQRIEGALEHGLGRAFGRNRNQEMAAFVIGRQGLGCLAKGFHSNADGFRAIIFSLDQLAATIYAGFRFSNLVEVIHLFARRAGAASSQPGDNFIEWQFIADSGIEL